MQVFTWLRMGFGVGAGWYRLGEKFITIKAFIFYSLGGGNNFFMQEKPCTVYKTTQLYTKSSSQTCHDIKWNIHYVQQSDLLYIYITLYILEFI